MSYSKISKSSIVGAEESGFEVKESSALSYLGGTGFSASAAGGKAAALHELMSAGFPVPPAFVVLPQTILDHIESELDDAVTAVGGYPVAVRSSAQLEDLAAISFAGQYTTHLEVRSLAGLIESINACRGSAHSPETVSYLKTNGFGQGDVRVTVLVQKMVEASVAGVTFSIHPETGREEHALVECCRGLGNRLLSGRISPTRYVVRLENGSVVERHAGAEDVRLDGRILDKLCRHALELQAHFGVPQDIEWALDSCGDIWILQSRPITRIHWRDDVEEFTNANFRDGGISARVCTPLMYSLYREAFQESMQQYCVSIRLLSNSAPQQLWISMFYGRPYWSASVVKKLLCKVPGYDEARFDQDVGIQKDYGNAGPVRTPTNLRTVLRAVPVAIAVEREFRRQLRRAQDYGQQFLTQEADYLRLAGSSSTMADSEFFPLFVEVLSFHKRTHSDYLKTVYNHVNYQAEFKKLLARIHAATGEPMAPLVLMSGLLDISHMKIQLGFIKLVRTGKEHGTESKEWNDAVAEFLSANSFQGDAELDISAPRWRERPDRIRQMVEGILHSGIEPKDAEATAQEQFQLYSEELRRVQAILHRSVFQRLRFGRSFCKRLNTARMYASRREEMREYAMHADDVVRRFVLEAGRRLHRREWLRREEDVFMLHTDELKAFAHDYVDKERILAKTEFRRLMYRGYRAVEPPGELGTDVSQHSPAGDLPEPSQAELQRGIGCSAGIVIANARVLSGIAESSSLRDGEILVTKFTDPAWTPIMGLVAGLVAEVGGVLSHGAVIAREYGVPAVLNVQGATEIIKTGQVLEIDGSNGTVKILDATTHAFLTGARAAKPCGPVPQIAC